METKLRTVNTIVKGNFVFNFTLFFFFISSQTVFPQTFEKIVSYQDTFNQLMLTDEANNIYTLGGDLLTVQISKFDSSGSLLWLKKISRPGKILDPTDFIFLNHHHIIIQSVLYKQNSGISQVSLYCMDTSGQTIFSTSIGDTSAFDYYWPNNIINDGDDFIVSVQYNEPGPIFNRNRVIRFDSLGNIKNEMAFDFPNYKIFNNINGGYLLSDPISLSLIRIDSLFDNPLCTITSLSSANFMNVYGIKPGLNGENYVWGYSLLQGGAIAQLNASGYCDSLFTFFVNDSVFFSINDMNQLPDSGWILTGRLTYDENSFGNFCVVKTDKYFIPEKAVLINDTVYYTRFRIFKSQLFNDHSIGFSGTNFPSVNHGFRIIRLDSSLTHLCNFQDTAISIYSEALIDTFLFSANAMISSTFIEQNAYFVEDFNYPFNGDCANTSLDEKSIFKADYLQIYPVPSNDILQIESFKDGVVELYNLTGCIVKTAYINEGNNQLDISDLKQDFYFIRLTNSEGVVIKKIIKL